MKIILLIITLIVIVTHSSFSKASDDSLRTDEPEWEMKTYYFVFLNANPDRPKLDSAKAMEIQTGHLANIERMFKAGKCKLAGPFLEEGETRGILILDVASLEEANELLKNDPAISNNRLIPVMKKWYGPANLIVEPKARK